MDMQQAWKGTLSISPEGVATIKGNLAGAGGENEFEMKKSTPVRSNQPKQDRINSGARFNSITGQVEISPDPEEEDWIPCTLKTVIYVGDHIMTGDKSTAVIEFEDMSVFVMRENGEITIASPPGRITKVGLVLGRLWANTKRLFADGQIEIEMGQAVAGIKGTTFVCEQLEDMSTLKVIEGSVELSHQSSGEKIMVQGGQFSQANDRQILGVWPFDADVEQREWDDLGARGGAEPSGGKPLAPTAQSQPVSLFDNSNAAAVRSGPNKPTRFTLSQSARLTYLRTYHYNNGAGTEPGTIALRDENGVSYGPFPTKGMGSGSGVQPIMWYCEPNIVVPPGVYTIIDSQPATWSCNDQSDSVGIAWVSGIVQLLQDQNPDDSSQPTLGDQDLEAIFSATPEVFKARYQGRKILVKGIFLQAEHASRRVIVEVGEGFRLSGAQIENGTPNAFESVASFTPVWISGIIYRKQADPDFHGIQYLILEEGGEFGIQ